MRILLIEDDVALRQNLAAELTNAGFNVDVAADGEEGLYAALEYPLDAAIVDLGLPKIDGADVIRRVRAKQRALPMLVLTARQGWPDTVRVLEAGADDYMRKPFQFEEVLARVRTLMRRSSGWLQAELLCEPIALHMPTQRVRVHGVQVELTTFEYSILEQLMLRAGEIVTKTDMRERLYCGETDADDNVIPVLLGRLRRKLDPEGIINPIETVHGRGYRFRLARTGGQS